MRDPGEVILASGDTGVSDKFYLGVEQTAKDVRVKWTLELVLVDERTPENIREAIAQANDHALAAKRDLEIKLGQIVVG